MDAKPIEAPDEPRFPRRARGGCASAGASSSQDATQRRRAVIM
jgi:hypothetical protein